MLQRRKQYVKVDIKHSTTYQLHHRKTHRFPSDQMAKALPLFAIQRLELLARAETEALTGFEGGLENVKELLRAIAGSLERRGRGKTDGLYVNWVNALMHLLRDLDNQLDDFLVQIHQQHGIGRSELTESFRIDLEQIQSHLTEMLREIMMQNSSILREGEKSENHEAEGETSASSSDLRSKLINLPYYVHPLLLYCCIFPGNHWLPKGKLIRLAVAENLVLEKAGQTLEDVAEGYIEELVSHGMLQIQNEHPGSGLTFMVSPSCREFLHEKKILATSASCDSINTPSSCRILTSNMKKVVSEIAGLRPRSLFLFGKQDLSEGNWLDLSWAKFLRVLDLEDTKIKTLPDEVGDLIFLAYICLKNTDVSELPLRLFNLQSLQTLDIRWCGHLTVLSSAIIYMESLRHLKMFKNVGVSGMRLPEGIARLTKLLTLTGIYVSSNTARELSELRQFRRLGIMDFADENLTELYESLMEMQGLLSLSLEAKRPCSKHHLRISKTFCPPPLLRKLQLEGLLENIPSWLSSMENLTKLRLGYSHLSESPMLVLEGLPNLKNLTLWHAFDAKRIGKEFCRAGRFVKLEVLSIASHVLEEWTELEEGALPSLQYLHFHNCLRLRMLPEGLQLVTTMKQLDLLPLLDDHAKRLKPDGGEENYKISNIPVISFLPMSAVTSIAGSHARQCTSDSNCEDSRIKPEE